jgi:hypothetical protein
MKAMLLLPLRRIHQRYPLQNITSYSHRDKHFLTLTLNLGLGGMKIKTHYHLPEGELFDFTLELGEASIGLKGRTVYSHALPNNQKVSGIEFMHLSEQDRTILRDYLITLEPWPKKRGMHSPDERTASREKKRPTVGSRR